jgi:uncharacterized protein HemX
MFIMSQEDDKNHAREPRFHEDTEQTDKPDGQAANKASSRLRVLIVLLVIALVIGTTLAGYYYYWRPSHRGNPLNFR